MTDVNENPTGKVTEEELIKRSDAPRITLEKLKENIKNIDYYVHPGSQLTICIITLQNGYTVTGESACADPANFKKDVGERLALEKAEKQIWPLMGYYLKQEMYLAGQGTDFTGRLKAESLELEDKLSKLNIFIEGNEIYKSLAPVEQDLLRHQRIKMREYAEILKERINIIEAKTRSVSSID